MMDRISDKASALGVPLGAHLDLTWRCNEGCGHCYLDHSVGGDMTTAEIKDVLGQLAAAGTLFLTISGGEIMLRKDIFEIVAHARSLLFDIKLKTNGILIGEKEAERFAALGVREVDISIYSHRPETHDAITRVPGSFVRSVEAVRWLRLHGLVVEIRSSIMRGCEKDYPGIKALAAELGVKVRFDPTITPRLDGDATPISNFQIPLETLRDIAREPNVVFDMDESCAPPSAADEQFLDSYPCGAGNRSCYISPSGDVTPCIQFPLVCGNLRREKFQEIWRNSPGFLSVREIRNRDLGVCGSCSHLSTCTRCPGHAYREGDLTGPSSHDCDISYARTGIPAPVPMATARPALRHEKFRDSSLVPLAALLPAPATQPYRDAAAY
ncbi:MAG: radical SAM protein [Bryobacteraceae bacterium]